MIPRNTVRVNLCQSIVLCYNIPLMPFAPVFALVAPLGGFLVLLIVAYIPRLKPYGRYVAPLGAGLSLLGVLFAPLELQRPFLLSRWQPLPLFGTFPVLLADRPVWPLALAWAGALAGGALVQMSRPQLLRLSIGGAVLGMLVFGLGATWSENVLTLLLAWAGFDLAWGIGMVVAGLPAERAVWGTGTGMAATVLLWIGALVLEKFGCGLSWPGMMPAGWGGTVLFLAALVRLGVYPFHLVFPAEMRRGRPITAAMLLEPLLAWGLLARMSAQAGLGIPSSPWPEIIAAATFLVGSFLAWAAADPDRRTIWIGMAAVGGVLWAGLRSSTSAAAWIAGGTAWALGLTLLYLGRGWAQKYPLWTVAPGIGGLAILVAPLISGGAVSSAGPVGIIVFFLGQALLTAAAAKDVLRPAVEEERLEFLPTVAHAAGLAIEVLALLLGLGAAPKVAPAGLGWAIWGTGTLVGGALFWAEKRRTLPGRRRIVALSESLQEEWAGHLLVRSLGRLTAFLDAAADVAEGPGAILWALATFLLILVIVLGR